MNSNENARVDVTITIEHAGPDWVIGKKNLIDGVNVRNLIDHVRFLAPLGSTITVKISPVITDGE